MSGMSQSSNHLGEFNSPFPPSSQNLFHLLLWPHAKDKVMRVLEELSAEAGVTVVSVIREDNVRLRRVLEETYATSVVPSRHLRSKLSYLRRMTGPKTVFHIFADVQHPQYQLHGEGSFRHIRSKVVNDMKWRIRDVYNPKKDGQPSDHHIIHASDSHVETETVKDRIESRSGHVVAEKAILRYVGSTESQFLRFLQIPTSDLRARIWVKERISLREPQNTPHYESLISREVSKGREIYNSYQGAGVGLAFRDGHNWTRYQQLVDRVRRTGEYEPILVEYHEELRTYVILDGAHRAAIATFLGHTHVSALALCKGTS